MPRVRRGSKARRRRNRMLKHAKGYYSARGRQFSTAVEQVHRAWANAYADRKKRKRDFRSLWITRIGAAARQCGTSYSRLMAALRGANVILDRKILADIAVYDQAAFAQLVEVAKSS